MRVLLAAALLAAATATAQAGDCPVSAIEKALAAPLDTLKKTQREVSDIQSTEGGLWQIYRRKDGKLHSIVRIDGGESGMGERRLSIVDAKTYGIAVTRVDYLRHAFIDEGGPNGTAKRTTEYYYFCAGKLLVPPEQYATVAIAGYAAAGAEARKMMVEDKDVADVTKALAR